MAVIRPVVYKFLWKPTQCGVKPCTNQTMVVRNASFNNR